MQRTLSRNLTRCLQTIWNYRLRHEHTYIHMMFTLWCTPFPQFNIIHFQQDQQRFCGTFYHHSWEKPVQACRKRVSLKSTPSSNLPNVAVIPHKVFRSSFITSVTSYIYHRRRLSTLFRWAKISEYGPKWKLLYTVLFIQYTYTVLFIQYTCTWCSYFTTNQRTRSL